MARDEWRKRAARIRIEVRALVLAIVDPRTPWYARLLAILVVAYAFSPLDLIPDPIPVLGYLDDVILIPAGVALLRRLIPAEVMADCRARAAAGETGNRWFGRLGAVIVVGLWIALLAAAGYGFYRIL